MKRFTVPITLFAATIIAAAVVLPGCETGRSGRIDQEELSPSINLVSTARQIYVGEVVTVTTKTANLLGHDADVRWNTTGGELEEVQEGRVARVRFDRPGTYIVSAQLMIDGEPFESDSVSVEVLPLR